MKKIGFLQEIQMARRWLTQKEEICNYPYKSIEYIRDTQLKKIQKLVSDAYTNVPFYKKKYSNIDVDPRNIRSFEDFKKLPTISKNDLLDNEKEFIDGRYNIKKLICSKTSGTSGAFLDIYCPQELFVVEELQVLRMLKELYPEYNKFSREVLVYTSEYPVSSIMGFYKAHYINNLESPEAIFNFIKAIKPSVVAIYPSILREIINRIEYDFKVLGIKLILTNSEQSSQKERDFFSSKFGCPVYDEFSSEELQSIAYQCPKYAYHEVSDCTYIELLDVNSDRCVENGEIGEIVGTCFINTAMPIIRYRQGDLAEKISDSCDCGKNTPIIGLPIGRNNASFKKLDGSVIPSGRLLDWSYSLVLEHKLPIKEFQMVQEDIQNISIWIVMKNTINSADIFTYIKKEFTRTFGKEFVVNVIHTKAISKAKGGKFNSIISKV